MTVPCPRCQASRVEAEVDLDADGRGSCATCGTRWKRGAVGQMISVETSPPTS